MSALNVWFYNPICFRVGHRSNNRAPWTGPDGNKDSLSASSFGLAEPAPVDFLSGHLGTVTSGPGGPPFSAAQLRSSQTKSQMNSALELKGHFNCLPRFGIWRRSATLTRRNFEFVFQETGKPNQRVSTVHEASLKQCSPPSRLSRM